jgi:hypothetical protein
MVEMSNIKSKNFLGEGALAEPVDTFVNTVAKPVNSFVTNNLAKPVNSFVNQPSTFMNTASTLNNKIQDGFDTFGTTIRNTATNLNKRFTNSNVFGTIATGPKSNESIFTTLQPNAFASSTPTKTIANSATNTSDMLSEWGLPIGIFLFFTLIFALLFQFFSSEIRAGYENVSNAIRKMLNLNSAPPQPIHVSTPPPATQGLPTVIPPTPTESILETVLPSKGPAEVFNVSKNEFSYYDAEPLCKALGAELATFNQVKEAYNKGADWCNYGWVKGQVAVYPTQKASWDELQTGEGDEREACGKPGVNGGYFDNAEMKFGVNCYGTKPSQSGHDEAALMKNGRLPLTASSLKTEEKVRQFQAQANELGILPFSKNKWDSN